MLKEVDQIAVQDEPADEDPGPGQQKTRFLDGRKPTLSVFLDG